MGGEWKETTLGEIAEIVMGQSPPGETCNTMGFGVALLNGPTEFGSLHPLPVQFTTDPKRFAEKGDILFCVRGSTTGRMNKADQKYAIGRGLAAIRHKLSEELQPFLKAVVDYHLAGLLISATGTTFPNINRPQLHNLLISLPPENEQKAIAHILGTLDDKIELNRKMNETLEAIAQTLFKSWFVDFDPVIDKALAAGNPIPDELSEKAERRKQLGDKRKPLPGDIASIFPNEFERSKLGWIPKGWRAGVIGNIASITLGGQWGKDSIENGFIPVICLRGCDMQDLRSEGFAPNAPVRFIKENAIDKRLLHENEILIAASGAGPCGRPLWCTSLMQKSYDYPLIFSNFVKKFATPGPEYAVYLDRLIFIKFQDNSIKDFITGTSVPNLDSNGLLNNCQIVIPSQQILNAYYILSQPFFQKLYSGENTVLSHLRDTLLPKLISGELRVPDAEKLIGEVTA